LVDFPISFFPARSILSREAGPSESWAAGRLTFHSRDATRKRFAGLQLWQNVSGARSIISVLSDKVLPRHSMRLFFHVRVLSAFLFVVVRSSLAAQGTMPATDLEFVRYSAPELLTFQELIELSDTAQPAATLGERLIHLLSTPIISNEAYYRGARPRRPSRDDLGPLIRSAMWNIERGTEFDLIRYAFTDETAFEEEATQRMERTPPRIEEIRRQVTHLQETDILILNEVDLGMTQSDYRDVAGDLAAALNMNYVFGVEFVEIDELELGLETLEPPDEELAEQFRTEQAVDQSRYRGLHGTAVLTRYPIRSARIHRLRVCYDWYGNEKKEIAQLERGRRLAADRLFLERIAREVRHGGRMALILDLEVPESPTGTVTVVAPHLENKSPASCRRGQMEELLQEIQEIRNPVILGGDLNTTGSDGAPTSVIREISKRVKNPKFWAGQAIHWFNPVNITRFLVMPSNYFKNYLDPTARHVPFFAPNREEGLFSAVEKFRFADGYTFDLRGDRDRTYGNRGNTFGNSNHRAAKGFVPTFAFQRNLRGLVGRFKLDWFFIKPFVQSPRDPVGSYWFAPHYPLTMQALNEAVLGQVSDHHPITVDLPITDPDQRAHPIHSGGEVW